VLIVTNLKIEAVVVDSDNIEDFILLNTKFDGYNLIATKSELLGSMDHEWGCRTKAVTRLVGDPEEFKKYFYCEHKIICYGDWVRHLKAVVQFLKIGFVNKLYLPID
jgi:hypothetical protein